MKTYYHIMKVGYFLKTTNCMLNSEYVILTMTESDYQSSLKLSNTCETLRNGIDVDKYYIKAMPVNRNHPETIVPIFQDNKNFDWYIKHALNGDANDIIDQLKSKLYNK